MQEHGRTRQLFVLWCLLVLVVVGPLLLKVAAMESLVVMGLPLGLAWLWWAQIAIAVVGWAFWRAVRTR